MDEVLNFASFLFDARAARENAAFNIFHLIFPYLNEPQQAAARRRLIPVMLRPDLFAEGGARDYFIRETYFGEK